MSVSVRPSVCPSVCFGSALWSQWMPGRGEGSSRAMLATARPSCSRDTGSRVRGALVRIDGAICARCGRWVGLHLLLVNRYCERLHSSTRPLSGLHVDYAAAVHVLAERRWCCIYQASSSSSSSNRAVSSRACVTDVLLQKMLFYHIQYMPSATRHDVSSFYTSQTLCCFNCFFFTATYISERNTRWPEK